MEVPAPARHGDHPGRRIAPWLLPVAALALAAAKPPPGSSTEPAAGVAAMHLDRETELIRQGRLDEAGRALSRRMAARRDPRARADLLEAFAIQVFEQTPTLDDNAGRVALDYFEQAIDAYRLVFGVDSPEVATALVRRAEVERLLHPGEPAVWTDLAYEQAYRIRFRSLGPASPVTLSTLLPMAELRAVRSHGDPAGIEAAAVLLNQAVDGAPPGSTLRADALAALARLEAAYGQGQPGGPRPQIMTAGGATSCGAADLHDTLIFSGEPAALERLRAQFAKARLELRPCGRMMTFALLPGVDPSPVVDLLTDISAGRVKGVRMGLSGSPPVEEDAAPIPQAGPAKR